MKRWAVDLQAGEVKLSSLQDPRLILPEYVSFSGKKVFVLAVDELGAFVRAKKLIAEAKQ